jgi:type I restriction enzyme, R subunit
MPRNEAETRYELIDPVLRDKGYRLPYIRLETPAPVEPIDGGATYTGGRRPKASKGGNRDWGRCGGAARALWRFETGPDAIARDDLWGRID